MVQEPAFVNFLGHVPVVGTRRASKIVVHTTESWASIEGLGRYFESTKNEPEGSGRHNLGITYAVEASGRQGRYCRMDDEVQHVAKHNSECVGIEQCNFASTSRADWEDKFLWQLRGTAWIVAWYAERHAIPLRICAHNHVWIYGSGVCQHKDVPDNDHDDCGPGYPMALMMHKAIYYRQHGVPLSVRRHLARLA